MMFVRKITGFVIWFSKEKKLAENSQFQNVWESQEDMHGCVIVQIMRLFDQ